MVPHSGHIALGAVLGLAERWRERWPSARHPTPAACLTVINTRLLLLDTLLRWLPASTHTQQENRQV